MQPYLLKPLTYTSVRKTRINEKALEGHGTDNTPKEVPKRSANCIAFSGNP